MAATITAAGLVIVIVIAFALYAIERTAEGPPNESLPTTPSSYIGVYARNAFTGVKAFTATTGVKPRVVVYYSGWPEPFRASFAATAASNGEVPLVQMNPTNVNLTAITAGQYDSYLRTFAQTVRAYHRPIILSFGHEMNGDWYSWGYTHTTPAAFVAAWRHIVTLFRAVGAQNVTWLWTVNAIQNEAQAQAQMQMQARAGVPSPGPWWPGSAYVNWVGIDGYYTTSSSVFSSLFGPTIADVRAFTRDPVLITETSATPASGQPAKVTDLFAGVHLYGLLGFVWFDTATTADWRLTGPEAAAAFRRGAAAYPQGGS